MQTPRFQSFQKLQIRHLFLQFLNPSVLVRMYFCLINKTTGKILQQFLEIKDFAGT